MYAFIFTLPLLLAGLALCIVLAGALIRAWSMHRVKMAVLKTLEHQPDLEERLPELRQLYTGTPYTGRFSLAIMGTTLALLGIIFLLVGQRMGFGRMAAGLYFGGAACVPLGFTLALAGGFFRMIERNAQDEA